MGALFVTYVNKTSNKQYFSCYCYFDSESDTTIKKNPPMASFCFLGFWEISGRFNC